MLTSPMFWENDLPEELSILLKVQGEISPVSRCVTRTPH